MTLPCAMADSSSDSSFFHHMISQLRSTCKYYTGSPKDLGPSRVIHFTSEGQFINILQEDYPVVVAFTIRGNYTKHLDKVLKEAAAEFYPNVKFVRVECPKYPGFCIARQNNEYPFIEIHHSPKQAENQGRMADPKVIRYNVTVLPERGRKPVVNSVTKRLECFPSTNKNDMGHT